jgi:hypothetical protein
MTTTSSTASMSSTQTLAATLTSSSPSPSSISSIMSRPMISYRSLRRARHTLDDFAKTYLPFHGLHAVDFFNYMPLLVFVECSIYQMDEENEDITQRAQARALAAIHTNASSSSGGSEEDKSKNSNNNIKRSENDSNDDDHITIREYALTGEDALRSILIHESLLTPSIIMELNNGRRYWSLERYLCARMARQLPIDITLAITAHELKSFDYRILHLLLFALVHRDKLQRTPPPSTTIPATTTTTTTASEVVSSTIGDDNKSMTTEVEEAESCIHTHDGRRLRSMLLINEWLTDIHDDLYDYERDVTRNSFNLYRMYVACFGILAPVRLAERISKLETAHERRRRTILTYEQQSHLQQREQEAYREGGKGADKWILPTPILDERAWRIKQL